MTKTELLEIIANQENSGVEFKRDDIGPEDLAKECVALVNLKGGLVLLGVEDDGTISGLTRSTDEVERWIMDTVFGRKITPSIIPYYEEITVEENKRVGIIQLEQGISKPYAVIRNDRHDIYIRVGRNSRIADRDQIIRLAQESGLHTEIIPVSGSSINDFDIKLFLSYLKFAYNESFKISDIEAISHRLQQLDLIVKHEKLGWVCTLAGLLLFGKNPKRFLHQSGFRIIGYKGEEADYDNFVDEEVNSSIAELRDESDNIIQYGIVSILIERLKPYIYSESLNTQGKRFGNWKYPFEVIRELIVNALVHRDWTKANQNKIEIFSNRIEVSSFGSLPNTLTLEKVLAGQQYPRNPILVRVVKDYKYMDDRGLGIRRKVIPILKDNGFPEPIFETTEDFVKVTVYQK